MDKFSDIELATVRKHIDAVDLTSTIDRLVTVHHWKKAWALQASHQYRNYLFLKIKYSETYMMPPSLDIDEVWHSHVLHTEEYYEFCQRAFGRYLHHHPHHGKDGSLTDEDIARTFESQTQAFYYREFGEYIEAVRPLPIKLITKRLIKFTAKKIAKLFSSSREPEAKFFL